MFNQKTIIVLYIDRNRFQIGGGNLTGIVNLEVPEVLIHDLEVVGKDALYSLIKQWVKQYNIVGTQLIIIFSQSSYFEKNFSPMELAQVETDVLKFFDTVPLESIWTKVYMTDKGKRAVAISKSLYEAIHQGFSLQGLQTKSVIPMFALGPLAGKNGLDEETITYVLNNVDNLGKQSLLDTQELSVSSPQEKIIEPTMTQKKSSNLSMLLVIFGVLITILVVVVFISR